MTCLEAQALITPFINDKLECAQLEEFIKHVQECPDCMEELEVYYALLTAMKQLDEDDDLSTDFKKELHNKLKYSEEEIIREKIMHIKKRVVYVIVVCVIGIVSSISVGAIEEVLHMGQEEQFDLFAFRNQIWVERTTIMEPMKIQTYKEVMQEVEERKIKEEEKKQEELLQEQIEQEENKE